ncbi:class I SAM-dependent methyltransferase [Belliella sp. R4-6]|uniref:Class I SAM-dependent methyltransferase n=1 Tax=Belliella alkalica TaxID=1730871 RepID=A0ABS9VDW4_9BACT|nr:class I SAM-dependent methyltransferase [Belliella alkalica]MCH7414583.1 class I SAM-dependent methyltransferase [Belliella alkalica]
MKKRLTKCPLCKSGLFLNHMDVLDYSISKEKFVLCKCSNCTFVFTNPRPDIESIGKYYEFEDYISHQDKSNNLINRVYKVVRNITLRKKINWINNFQSNKGRLLDIGCGTGYFLNAAKKNGWITTGIEPNENARSIAKSFNIDIHADLDELHKDEKYDAITMFHVLEHVHSLRKSTKKIKSKLKNTGTLFIAVPNIDSWDSKYYKQFWAALDVPRHLYHFDQSTVQKLAEEMGLTIVEIKPMVFDSYYVSILSEKNKNPDQSNIKTLWKALINGYKSNRWAKSNNNNYSSILYILKKK